MATGRDDVAYAHPDSVVTVRAVHATIAALDRLVACLSDKAGADPHSVLDGLCAPRCALRATRRAHGQRLTVTPEPHVRRYCLKRELASMVATIVSHDADIPFVAIECAPPCGSRAYVSGAPPHCAKRSLRCARASRVCAHACARTRLWLAAFDFAAGASTMASTRSACTFRPTGAPRLAAYPPSQVRWRSLHCSAESAPSWRCVRRAESGRGAAGCQGQGAKGRARGQVCRQSTAPNPPTGQLCGRSSGRPRRAR